LRVPKGSFAMFATSSLKLVCVTFFDYR
jgi:hypothetical protein